MKLKIFAFALNLVFIAAISAATITWTGGTADIPNVWKITPTGAWANAETVTVSGGAIGDDLVITLGSTSATSTTTVAEAIYDAINATNRTDDINSDESRNVGGQEIYTIAELAATVSGDVVTVTSNDPGIYQTLAVSETATSGAITLTQVQTATGKNFWSEGGNWSSGSAPITDDIVIIENSTDSILYGLPTIDFQPASLDVRGDYVKSIGLPAVDAGGNYEWRNRYMAIEEDSGGSDPVIVKVGEGGGDGPALFNLFQSGVACDITVYATTSMNILGETHGNILKLYGGNVRCLGVAATPHQLDTIKVATGSTLFLEDTCTATSSAVTIDGGTVDWEAAGSGGTLIMRGGTLALRNTPPATITVSGGTITPRGGGNITLLSLTDTGVFDATFDYNTPTITDLKIYDGTGVGYKDPRRVNTITNPVEFIQCGLDRADFGENIEIDVTGL